MTITYVEFEQNKKSNGSLKVVGGAGVFKPSSWACYRQVSGLFGTLMYRKLAWLV